MAWQVATKRKTAHKDCAKDKKGEQNRMQHVFLVGAKSLGAYGGYETFINKLFSTIKTSINSVLMILSVVILFNILTTLIQHIFSLNDITSTLINGILEMTGGIAKISCLNINNILKFIFSFYILNFGGICIHMQALSMIKSKKIKYFKYLIFRLF